MLEIIHTTSYIRFWRRSGLTEVYCNLKHCVNVWCCKKTYLKSRNICTRFWSMFCLFVMNVVFFNLILVTAIGGRPEPGNYFLSGQLRWTLFGQGALRRFIQWMKSSGCRSNTQPSNREADTTTELWQPRLVVIHFRVLSNFVTARLERSPPANWGRFGA